MKESVHTTEVIRSRGYKGRGSKLDRRGKVRGRENAKLVQG